jgi:mannose-6-phosphate isomerase
VAVSHSLHECRLDWEAIADELRQAIARGRSEKPILVVECYPGVDERMILTELESRLSPELTIPAAEALLPPAKIDALVAPFLGRDDPSFGRLSNLSLVNFFAAEPLWRFRRIIDEWKTGLILIVGCGASLIAWGNLLVYADLTRREARLRFARNEAVNLGAQNQAAAASQKSERAFFVDWRMADRWKRPLINRWDFVLDTNNPQEPKLADAEDVRRGLSETATRPFRWVPFFEPSPWGGQKPKELRGLDRTGVNFGRGLDCVPEENSLVLGIGGTRIELPALDLVFNQPQALLGHAVHVTFRDEFPIRFDLIDTMGGRFEPIGDGDGWREERIGLDREHFIETRRHWFQKPVRHHTHHSVNVLNLVEGEEIMVESPAGAFAPFSVHYAETFIVPASVVEYTIRPHGPSIGHQCATIKAFVQM